MSDSCSIEGCRRPVQALGMCHTRQSEGTPQTVDELVDAVRSAQLPPPERRREIRHRAGVSLRQVAAVLDVDQMTVQRWETGAAKPVLQRARQYKELLDRLDAAVGDE